MTVTNTPAYYITTALEGFTVTNTPAYFRVQLKPAPEANLIKHFWFLLTLFFLKLHLFTIQKNNSYINKTVKLTKKSEYMYAITFL
jgi:hypothetical protein